MNTHRVPCATDTVSHFTYAPRACRGWGIAWCTARFEAHKFIPCFDQPDLKARLTLTATAPESWVVVGNDIGTKGETTTTAAGERRSSWTFATAPPISTYLFAICAGPYAVRTDTYTEGDSTWLFPHCNACQLTGGGALTNCARR